jgi:hypothetical protein
VQDVYGKNGDLLTEAERQVVESGLAGMVDMEKMRAVALAAEGVAADVTRISRPVRAGTGFKGVGKWIDGLF